MRDNCIVKTSNECADKADTITNAQNHCFYRYVVIKILVPLNIGQIRFQILKQPE